MQGNIRVIPIKLKVRPLTICHYTFRRINFNVSRIIQIKLRACTSYFNSLTLNTCCLQIKIDLLGINPYEIPPFACIAASSLTVILVSSVNAALFFSRSTLAFT